MPYVTRQRELELTYNFTCTCSLCQLSLSPALPFPSRTELALVESQLREHVLSSLSHHDSPIVIRDNFSPVLHSSFLPSLADSFSNASHDGPYEIAVQKGATLLAVYSMLYPPNHPMIGQFSLHWTSASSSIDFRLTLLGVGKDLLECIYH